MAIQVTAQILDYRKLSPQICAYLIGFIKKKLP